MTPRYTPADFGEPDLTVAGFQLWIHGRQYPDLYDAFDGNWLRVTAHCGASGASVCSEGAMLMTGDIARFQEECRKLRGGSVTVAELDSLEPEFAVAIERTDQLGHLRARVDITPDHLNQSHRFDFEIDQSYLPAILESCRQILEKYPVRG